MTAIDVVSRLPISIRSHLGPNKRAEVVIAVGLASMFGSLAVRTEVPIEVVNTDLWTLDSIAAVVLAARQERDAESAHLLRCWLDMAHKPVLVAILEYAGRPADLGPSTLGRYNPVAAETQFLQGQLEDALIRDAACYFEPPLRDEFMRWKYFALYIFHFVDDGVRFEMGRATRAIGSGTA